jgi:hypothetical protein
VIDVPLHVYLVDIGSQRGEARVGHRVVATVLVLGACQERCSRAGVSQVGLSHLGHRGGSLPSSL